MKYKLFFISFLVIFIILNTFVDFNNIFQFILNRNFKDLIRENIWEYYFIYLFLNSVYIFFYGFGSISLIFAIIIFKPVEALVLCVISKSLGSTFNIIFFQKNIFNQIKINYKKTFLQNFLKVPFLFVMFLRIIPGFPIQFVNSTISFLRIDIKNQIIGSIIGFTLSNGIGIFFLNNFYEIVLIFANKNENKAIEVYQIVLVLIFVLFLIFLGKWKKSFYKYLKKKN